ncbi:hypothetical protein GCM10023165_48680 [Variovorax defluvii]|uniref:DUF420 domain-containing protein n=1 Tax=Variovorax defluvii TaxID=913761 RepID=A0ABP8ICE2_9BURK
MSTLVDLNGTHLFNPAWHPHAVFHDALMLLFLAAVTAIALWMLWRKDGDRRVAVLVATLVPIAFWTPFFYITWILPNSSLNAFDEPLPKLAGITMYPNVIIAFVMCLLAVVGYRFARAEE